MIEKPLLLHIETATEVCSIALTSGNDVLTVCETNDGNSHSKNLLPFINDAMKQTHCQMNELNGVVVSIGPGSYTGLRIGVSMAKGIAYSLNIPIITVSTLESIAQGARNNESSEYQGLFIPMIDARRMEVFTATYDATMQRQNEVNAVIVEETTFNEIIDNNVITFCGNGMPKCREMLSTHPNARFYDGTLSAQNMLPAALKKWQLQDFADVAYFEPFYLKNYVAAKPNVKGLR